MTEEEDNDQRPGETEEDMKTRKRKERLEQNRISARESRKRKKTMIEELQRTVITLSKENKELNERNEQLRRQLMEIGAKYPNIVPLQAIVGQATATPPAGEAPPATNGVTTGSPVPGSPENGPVAATTPSSFMGALNPMSWLGGTSKPEEGSSAPSGSTSV